MENIETSTDKMLDVDEECESPLEAKKTRVLRKVLGIDTKPQEESKGAPMKTKIDAEKLMEVMKALTAMKLTKEDSEPGEVFPDIFLGSIGCAYNKEALDKIGITHILTCAAKIRPRFPEVSHYIFS